MSEVFMLINKNMDTAFAPSGRLEQEEIQKQAVNMDSVPMIHQLTDIIPDAFLILNKERQIIFSNQTFLDVTGIDKNILFGLRPGEALNCIYAKDAMAGCGTTKHCAYCGAVNAILKSQKNPGKVQTEECRLLTCNNTSLTFDITTHSLDVQGEEYTVFIAKDISQEKRRSALEKIFFHDILNTAGGIQGVVNLLHSANKGELNELIDMVQSSSKTLIEEIKSQKDMIAAENGELAVQFVTVNTLEILDSVKDIYINHNVCLEKFLVIANNSISVYIQSDPRILSRILGNMVKNALEASNDAETVTIGANLVDDGNVRFFVHNKSVMTESAQMQVFQRSFSTKGSGRGLGTYSIKLLGENFLKGKVSFISEEGKGTTFYFALQVGSLDAD